MNAFPSLSRPFSLRGIPFRNRIVQAPMCTMYAAADGSVTDRQIAYYRARARGGAGLIIVEITFTDAQASRAFHAQLGAHDDTMIPGLGELAAAIKMEGAVAGLQLGHCGPQRVVQEPPIVAPSPIPWAPGKRVPHELTVGEIEALVQDHARAGRRLAQAGFDLVELHGGHGYLLNAFLCPAANVRTDRYGGSTEKRLRFPVEAVSALREALGPKRLISFRINGDDLLPGGMGIEGYCDAARALAQAGVDLFHVSAGTYRVMEQRIPPMYLPEAPFRRYARPIREATGLPVIASGTIHDPELAERMVRDEEADFVSLARPLFADPDLPAKLLSGRRQAIRPCIRCNTCLAREQGGLRAYCAVNPHTGRERDATPPPAEKRRVAVVGAGPAGIEAALACAARGHEVTLYDRAAAIGGQLGFAARLPFKATLPRLLSSYAFALEESGVRVVLNTEPTPTSVEADAVVLATGVQWQPGFVDPLTAIARPERLGRRVAVVGANTIGAETAWWLGELGREVTLIERDPDFDDDVNLIQRMVLPGALAKAGVLTAFRTEYDGKQDFDTVVAAFGATPNVPHGIEAWQASVRHVQRAGECGGTRQLIGATYSGYRTGTAI